MKSAISSMATRHPLFFFFLLSYVFGWLGFLPVVLGDIGLRWIHGAGSLEFAELGAFGPLLAALCTQKLAYGNFRICRLFSSWTRTSMGLLLGVGITLASLVVLPALTVVQGSPRALHWTALVTPAAYVLNWSIFLGGPIDEEPGWRGFALPRLQAQYGPLKGTLLLGILWACWHLPLFLVQGWSSLPVWAYSISIVSLSVLMTLASNISKSSIVVPMLMHAMVNTSGQLLAFMTDGVPTREQWQLFFVLGPIFVVAICALLLTRGRLGYDQVSDLSQPRQFKTANQ